VLRNERDNQLALTVEDDGIGFRGDDLQTGMGQVLIAGLAEQLDGRIERRWGSRGNVISRDIPVPRFGG